jgi:hypothetical protein
MLRIYLIIAALAAILGGIWGISKLPEHYRDQGRKEVTAKYEAATKEAIDKKIMEIEVIKRDQKLINQKVVSDYELKLQTQANDYDKRIDAIRKSGGLRIPKDNSCRPTERAETTSSEGDNEANTIRLPERVEEGLFDLARKANEVVLQLGACQMWIRDNGFAQ